MKGKLVLGIVLLALLALTGVVSAGDSGNVTVSGDIASTLELTTRGSISNWVLHPPSTSEIGGVFLDVVNNGYTNGYQITVADKMDQDPCGHPKPSGTAGYMTLYKNSACAAGWGYNTTGSPITIISNLRVKAEAGDWVDLSGSDQLLGTNPELDSHSVSFRQDPGAGPSATKPAGYYGGNGYRIIVTFTAVPN